jgi:hypothetical protein
LAAAGGDNAMRRDITGADSEHLLDEGWSTPLEAGVRGTIRGFIEALLEEVRWPRLFGQFFRFDERNLCRVRLPSGLAACRVRSRLDRVACRQGSTGVSVEVLLSVYGHHQPSFQSNAAMATGKRQKPPRSDKPVHKNGGPIGDRLA